MSELLRTTDGGVATLTLNRPDSKNALTTALLDSLRRTLDDLLDSPEVRVVVLTGAGGTFCAGADLKEFADAPSAEGGQRRIRLVTEVIARLRNLEQPTVAVVTGAAFGAGWGLALACDLTVASASARFSLPEVPKGLRLPSAITGRLLQVVGPVRTAEIALGGAVYGPEQGLAAGWLSQVLPDERAALEHARLFTRSVAAAPRSAVANVKQVLRRGSPHDLTPPPEYAWNEEK
jgi:enoyl-CoA hydratase/carnithine racemase